MCRHRWLIRAIKGQVREWASKRRLQKKNKQHTHTHTHTPTHTHTHTPTHTHTHTHRHMNARTFQRCCTSRLGPRASGRALGGAAPSRHCRRQPSFESATLHVSPERKRGGGGRRVESIVQSWCCGGACEEGAESKAQEFTIMPNQSKKANQ